MALSLGDAQIDSRLNQPLRGSIPVVAASASELASLRVGLAGQQDWQRAGLSLTSAVTGIRFGFKSNGGGRLAITLRTDEPISEPLLVFLVDASWSSGHLLREYTAFLDPENLPQRNSAPIVTPSVRRSAPVLGSNSTTGSGGALSTGRYGPVRRGESLSTISERILVGTNLSRHQVVWALYQDNPHAFVDGNINLLSIGANLQVASEQEMLSVPAIQAREMVREAATQSLAAQRPAAQKPAKAAERTDPEIESASASSDSNARSDQPEPNQLAEADAGDKNNADTEAASAAKQGSGGAPNTPAQSGDKLELLPLEPNEPGAAESVAAGADGQNSASRDDLAAGDGSQAPAGSNSPRERQLENENAMLRERIDETEALLKEIRTLLAARSEQLSELQTRLDRVETQTFNNQQNNNQSEQAGTSAVGWFWWLLLALAVLIVVLMMLGLFLLARRQEHESAPSALSYHEDESDTDADDDDSAATETAVAAATPKASKEPVVDEEVEAFIESNLIMPRSSQLEPVAQNSIAPVLEEAEEQDSTEPETAQPEVEEITAFDAPVDESSEEGMESAVERRLPAEDSPLDFDLDEYSAAKPEPDATDAGASEAEVQDEELDMDLGAFDDELPDVASEDDEPDDDVLPILNDDDLESLEIDSELSVPGAGLAGLAAEGVQSDSEELDAADTSATDVSDFSGGDQVATKLDLARVYVDMGDADEARSILSEVLKQGDDHQKQEAQTLLDSLS